MVNKLINCAGLRKLTLVFGSICVSAFLGCGGNTENIPDTSAINIELKTSRFDKDLYAIDTNKIGEGLQQLNAKYPDFLNYFLDTIMAYGIRGNYDDTVTGIREGLRPFLVYKDFKELQNEIERIYPDTKKTDEQLLKGFKLFKYYFPDISVPEIIYLNMGLSNWPSFPVDNATLCIGLDMFLGDDFIHYRSIGVHDYMNAHLRQSYIPVSVFGAIYKGMYPLKTSEKTLLELIIQKGKEQYFLHKVLPSTPDSTLFGYKQKQIEWCNNNEALVYNFFIQNQLLYSKDAQNVMPYITDGPFARGLEPVNVVEKSTPGSIGTWLGYKIVAAYMANNKEVTLKQLIEQPVDAVRFLEMAMYKPR
jgi:hypothetical protein